MISWFNIRNKLHLVLIKNHLFTGNCLLRWLILFLIYLSNCIIFQSSWFIRLIWNLVLVQEILTLCSIYLWTPNSTGFSWYFLVLLNRLVDQWIYCPSCWISQAWDLPYFLQVFGMIQGLLRNQKVGLHLFSRINIVFNDWRILINVYGFFFLKIQVVLLSYIPLEHYIVLKVNLTELIIAIR